MVATVSPAADNYEETLSTLRYADRSVLFLYNEKCYFYFEIREMKLCKVSIIEIVVEQRGL